MTELEPAFRRVLVTLDASRASRRTLEASAELAAQLRAELVGLFVEDINILRMAALPFTRVVAPASGARDLDVPTVERALRAAAAEARGLLEGLARRNLMRCSFRVVRGLIASHAVGSAESGDLVVLEERPGGPALLAIAGEAQTSILLLGADPDRGSLVVAYPAVPAWERGVLVAAGLAAATGRSLVVAPPMGEERSAFQERLATLLADSALRWETIALPRDVEALAATVRARSQTVIALPRSGDELAVGQGVELEALIRLARCSVVLVR